MHPVSHVIFDFDGLLVDTENAYTMANRELLAPFGVEFTMELKRKQMGMKHDEAIGWLLDEVGIADKITVDEFGRRYDEILFEHFRRSEAMPGAKRLVTNLVANGVPVALCTGSCSRTFPVKAENHRSWIDLIAIQVLSGDDPKVKRGKPHPDPFLETASRFSEAPKSPLNVLVFEDSYNGVLSALNAGMQCVMVPDRSIFDPDSDPEFAKRVTQILPSLEDFQPELFGLPPIL
ncbi:unnamed protein product [Caenorhabditis bovis]|uniref:HAD family hydrolase n=1 Tax=Caenorhabditis bovis TaxID=2654633 RepID=A0A8S1EKZ4_9PELO|nr:unnamed protein product [Caenorhabditis bovis]